MSTPRFPEAETEVIARSAFHEISLIHHEGRWGFQITGPEIRLTTVLFSKWRSVAVEAAINEWRVHHPHAKLEVI